MRTNIILGLSLAVAALALPVLVSLQSTVVVKALTYEEIRNRIQQRNEAIANGAGNILQNQLNAANVAGDNNDVTQSNDAEASGDGDITQNQLNAAQIEGDNNDVTQSNKATASGDGKVTQQASNNAQIQGGGGDSND